MCNGDASDEDVSALRPGTLLCGGKPGPKPNPKPVNERTIVGPEPMEMLGSIRVQCSPAGSEIRIDGNSHGVTPRKIDEISLGQHRVEVSKTGYVSRSWMVEVHAGGTQR